ncbi:T9SS type A sorting domain-containing protein [Flavobacterium psychrotolerans]|uniref:Uncharacterized protein n=1 Tax=Flavobacterium psychrotolerans TaxID=2169410 RepID=A0A2U1JI71_9FLAO|nr:T9SS type A sorting domain-containing protein [Flavobacterium psychrotolerans]PWA04563.1 hypothetical protein DB895_10785 [Flavobacterium psychrotolerans]
MKKTILFIFLVLISFKGITQTAMADSVFGCYSGGLVEAYPLANDYVNSGTIDYASLDLDQTISGIQSSITVNGISFTADINGVVRWSGGIGDYQSCAIKYTFSDNLGNISNEETLYVYFDPDIFKYDDDFTLTPIDSVLGGTTISVLANDYVTGFGASPIFGVGAIGRATAALTTTDPNFTMNPDGTITVAPNTPVGIYNLNYRAYGPHPCTDYLPYLTSVKIEVKNAGIWKSVSVGDNHTSAIKTDGTLWSWGNNGLGSLGIGSTTDSNTPVQVGTDANWEFIASGDYHAIAIKNNGTLWAWGDNSYGQLGIGSTTQSNIPVQIGTDTDWNFASARYGSSAAIKNNGTLWMWGYNADGEIGNGTNTNQNAPVQITSSNDWKTISLGDAHTVAIKTDGTLYGWGLNDFGQLGNGNNISSNVPILSGGGFNQWKSVSASRSYTIALQNDGTLWAWGNNAYNQLGYRTTTDRNTPIQVGTDTDWSSISAGNFHRLALKSNGSLWAWGLNSVGELGDGTNTNQNTPVQIGTDMNWTEISAKSSNHSAALKSDGNLYTWGRNIFGQLGNCTLTNLNIPTLLNCTVLSNQEITNSDKVLSFYPNPTSSILNIQTEEKVISIAIYDLNGRRIKTQKSDAKSINISDLTNGLYFIEVNTANGCVKNKIVKQ